MQAHVGWSMDGRDDWGTESFRKVLRSMVKKEEAQEGAE